MSNTTDTGAHLRGLRDFFAAADSRGMAKAYALLAAAGSTPPPPADWLETEYAFNRLFVGPGPLAAPPYASVYLDPQPTLMGRSTSLVRGVHQALGVQSAWLDSVPDDHLALELDTALALRVLAGRDDLGGDRAALEELRAGFVADHMGRWVPLFADRVLGQRALPEPLVTVTRLLELWLQAEMASLPPRGGALPEQHRPSATGGADS